MIKILRKHRNWLMIVIAILALPFCLYFVKSDTSLIRSDNFVEMYGRKVTMTEAHRDARLFQLSQLLGMSDLRDGLAPGSGTDDQKASPCARAAAVKHARGARNTPAPICPPPLPATPMSITGVIPVATTLWMSIPTGMPRKRR